MNKIVCFTGVIGSGKDYQAQKLIEKGYTKIDFADALRREASEILEYDITKNYEIFKKYAIPKHFVPSSLFGLEITGREFLQWLGNKRRQEDKDYWCRKWEDEVLNTMSPIVCSDLRYPNELKIASEFNLEIYFTNYKSNRYESDNPHQSERLAQRLLNDGFKHMQKLTPEEIKFYSNEVNNEVDCDVCGRYFEELCYINACEECHDEFGITDLGCLEELDEV